MDKQQAILTKEKSKYQVQGKKNKSIALGSIIATFLALSPFLITLYESVPDERIWNTFLFEYDSSYYQSARTAAWTITSKLIPLLFLTLWFFTNRHWWYHALLVPMTMYLYQMMIILNDDLQFVDTNEQKLYLLPVMALIVPSIYLIRAKMFYAINNADKTLEEMEKEFMIKPKGIWSNLKQYF